MGSLGVVLIFVFIPTAQQDVLQGLNTHGRKRFYVGFMFEPIKYESLLWDKSFKKLCPVLNIPIY